MTTEESDPIAILDYSTSRSWILVTIRGCREGIPLNQPLWNNHLSFAQRTYWQYTRITPVALEIYEDNTHIKPSIGHSNNTGTHMFIFVRIYTRITPFAVDIYKDNTHIKPSIGHSINTGAHMYIFVRLYKRISPFALVIYEDNTHIKPSIGHGINTGTHMWQRVPWLLPCSHRHGQLFPFNCQWWSK